MKSQNKFNYEDTMKNRNRREITDKIAINREEQDEADYIASKSYRHAGICRQMHR